MALRDLWAKLTGREKPAEDPIPGQAPPPPETEPPAPARAEPEPAPEPPLEPLAEQTPKHTPDHTLDLAPEPAAPAEAEDQPQPPLHTHPAATAPAPAETRSPDPGPIAPPPPPPEPLSPVAPEETRSEPPPEILAELSRPPPGDLPQPPVEIPAPPRPGEGPLTESPARSPVEAPPPPALPEAPIPSAPPEQPAPVPEPAPAPPGWAPGPAEPPLPPAAPTAPPPPPETPAPRPLPELEPTRPPEVEPPPEDKPPASSWAEPLADRIAPPSPEPVFAAPEDVVEHPLAEPDEDRAGWFGRLRAGLSRSTARLTGNITGLFTKRRLDDEALEELEEALITADLGVAASSRIVENFRRSRFGREVTDQEVKEALSAEIATILEPVAQPLVLDRAKRPHVVLVAGVNGTGKTTTIAKLGSQWRAEGRSVTFVAGDTFRAAAVEQLQIWGNRTGCDVVAPARQGADAAGLAFDALKAAQEKGTEVLLVDTAGRLHNKTALMEELRKVVRVLQRLDPTAPHSVLLVLDATTGQNATQQAKVFSEMVNVTGLVVTKLDGSAKGGVVVALAQEFGLPVHAVGVGEKAGDLRPFLARDFARGLLGLG